MRNLIKKHIIKVDNIKDKVSSKKIEEKLQRVLGVNKVYADHQTGNLKVTYNLKFINFMLLEKKLDELGHPPIRNIYNSMKRGFINFTEKNEISSQKLKSTHNNTNPQGRPL
jgi:hypothetical protein